MDNPFAGQDIIIDEKYRERIQEYVQRRNLGNSLATHQPFERNVDIWFFAILFAVKMGINPEKPSGKTYKAAEGVVLSADSWRPVILTLLAISEQKNINIVESASEMMQIANSYANVGLAEIFALLEFRGRDNALDILCDKVEQLID